LEAKGGKNVEKSSNTEEGLLPGKDGRGGGQDRTVGARIKKRSPKGS